MSFSWLKKLLAKPSTPVSVAADYTIESEGDKGRTHTGAQQKAQFPPSKGPTALDNSSNNGGSGNGKTQPASSQRPKKTNPQRQSPPHPASSGRKYRIATPPSPRRRASEDCHYQCGCKNHCCGRAVEAPGDLCDLCMMHTG